MARAKEFLLRITTSIATFESVSTLQAQEFDEPDPFLWSWTRATSVDIPAAPSRVGTRNAAHTTRGCMYSHARDASPPATPRKSTAPQQRRNFRSSKRPSARKPQSTGPRLRRQAISRNWRHVRGKAFEMHAFRPDARCHTHATQTRVERPVPQMQIERQAPACEGC